MEALGLNEIALRALDNAKSKGFHESDPNIGEKLMLIVSELSEALEADRHGKRMKVSIGGVVGWVSEEDFLKHFKKHVKDTFEDELADVIIRVAHLSARLGIDIEAHVLAKMRYNENREHKHGGKKY